MAAPSFTPIPTTEARRIAQHALLTPGEKGLAIETAQVEHRIEIINAWGIRPGSRVLEVGCGQGNCTTVLAEFVGPEGHVDAFDPASPEYGAPFTLRQAQEHISKGPMGPRISWHNQDLAAYLKAEGVEARWDYVVFCHSIWYFDTRMQFETLLEALHDRAATILVAEYALCATAPSALPHVLAVVAGAMLESFKTVSEANVRTPLAPAEIRSFVENPDDEARGWDLESSSNIVPGEGLLDGQWEVGSVKRAMWLREILDHNEDPTRRQHVALRAARTAMMNALRQVGGLEAVRTMDVWVAVFRVKAAQ